MNKVMLIGNVGKDPVSRNLNDSGDTVSNFSIATSERWKDKKTGEQKEKTEWHNIQVFGPLAKIVQEHVRKGSKLYVAGQMQTRKWTDQSGNDKYTTEVVLRGFNAELEILSWPKDENKSDDDDTREVERPLAASKPKGYQALVDDEIPF